MTDPVETIRAYEQRVQEIAARAGTARARMAALRPTATSPDGAVTVTVTAVGALADLSFGPAAADLDLPELARLVVATAHTARLEAARQTESAVAELVGADAAARAMAPPVPLAAATGDEDEGYTGRGLR
jgi:DNA-binding protein YbaB